MLAFVGHRRGHPRGLPGELAEHAEKAAVNTLLGTAEAAGRLASKDRGNRFAIARRPHKKDEPDEQVAPQPHF